MMAQSQVDLFHCLVCHMKITDECSFHILNTLVSSANTLLDSLSGALEEPRENILSLQRPQLCATCHSSVSKLVQLQEEYKVLAKGLQNTFHQSQDQFLLGGQQNEVSGADSHTIFAQGIGEHGMHHLATHCQQEVNGSVLPGPELGRQYVTPVPIDLQNSDSQSIESTSTSFEEPVKPVKDAVKSANNRHICRLCGRGFRKPSRLKEHLNLHDTERALKCQFCEQVFTSKGSFAVHEKSCNEAQQAGKDEQYGSVLNAPVPTEVPCRSVSPALFASCQFDATQKSTSNSNEEPGDTMSNKHKCPICNRSFRRPGRLNAHINLHGSDQAHKCEFCEKVFTTKSSSTQHAVREHGLPLDKLYSIKETTKNANEYSTHWSDCSDSDGSDCSDAPYQSTFELAKPLNESTSVQKGDSVNQAGSSDKQSTKPQAKGSKPKVRIPISCQLSVFTCDQCGKQWNNRKALRSHLKTHIPSGPFTCEICGQAYKYKQSYDIHVGIHNGIHPFVCPYCKKVFGKKGAMQQHIAIHTKEGKYMCEVCGKSFVHHTSFDIHVQTHTGMRKVTCEVCGLGLFSNSSLRRHMRSHTGEKPYSCEVCGKQFSIRYNLGVHMRLHNSTSSQKEKIFNCRLCNKGFDRKRKLNEHLMSAHNIVEEEEEEEEQNVNPQKLIQDVSSETILELI